MQLVKIGTRLTALVVLMAGPVWADDAPQNSGFLGDDSVYAKLEEVEIRKDVTGKRWVGPKLNLTNYQSVLVEDVVLYPEPEPGPQVSAETLGEIRAYLSSELKQKVAAVLKVADAPAPNVVRLEAALTGVSIKTEGMKAYEVIPVAALFGGVKAATGARDRDVFVFVEARLLDSESGELVGAVMRQVQGKDLKGKKDQLEIGDMQDSLDQMSTDASGALSEILK